MILRNPPKNLEGNLTTDLVFTQLQRVYRLKC